MFTHQNIPQRVGGPCQTTSSWSDAPAHLPGGLQMHQSEERRQQLMHEGRILIHILVEFCTYSRKCKIHIWEKYADFSQSGFKKKKQQTKKNNFNKSELSWQGRVKNLHHS